MNKPLAFASIATKLGKMLPMLSSDKSGEVAAAAAAIGRILATVELDWHDLAKRVAEPTFADIMTVKNRPTASRASAPPERKPAEPPPPPKAKRPPPAWPTWATLSRFQRLAWMDVIKTEAGLMSAKETEAFARFYKAHYTLQDGWSRQDINLFNRGVRTLWGAWMATRLEGSVMKFWEPIRARKKGQCDEKQSTGNQSDPLPLWRLPPHRRR